MDDKNNIFFLGIGGIGMSALARYCNLIGKNVAGYDLTKTALTDELEQEGIDIFYEDNHQILPEIYRNPEETMVVYTPAIPSSNEIFGYFNENRYRIIKRSQMLGKVTQVQKAIAIAGTHGKTSISTFVTHLLMQTPQKCNAFLGGISGNYNTNFLYNDGAEYVVVEADEFDRSFLFLDPYISLVSSVEADHLDIYGTYAEVVKAFKTFVSLTSDEGKVIINERLTGMFFNRSNVMTYGLQKQAMVHAENIIIEKGFYTFDLVLKDETISGINLGVPGKYNLENAIGAAAVAFQAGVGNESIRKGLETLKGVKRRFEILLKKHVVYIDDYGHHPTEVEACIESVRSSFPGKKITVLFQPHLYTRTRDFAKEFAEALSLSDRIALLPVYPAREEPIPGVSSDLIIGLITGKEAKVIQKSEVSEFIKNIDHEVFISMGAGDIGEMTDKIVQEFEKKIS